MKKLENRISYLLKLQVVNFTLQ